MLCVVLSVSFLSRHFLISLVIFFFDPWVFKEYCLISMYLWIFQFSFCCSFPVLFLLDRNDTSCDFNCFFFCLPIMPGLLRGDLPNKPKESYAGYTQRGGAYVIEESRASTRVKSGSLIMSADEEVSVVLKSGAYRSVAPRVWWNGSPTGLPVSSLVVGSLSCYSIF